MNHSAYDDVTGIEEDPKHLDTPDPPRPGLGHLRAPRTHSPASDPESYRALVAVPGRAPLQVSRAQQGSTGYPHNCRPTWGLGLGLDLNWEESWVLSIEMKIVKQFPHMRKEMIRVPYREI